MSVKNFDPKTDGLTAAHALHSASHGDLETALVSLGPLLARGPQESLMLLGTLVLTSFPPKPDGGAYRPWLEVKGEVVQMGDAEPYQRFSAQFLAAAANRDFPMAQGLFQAFINSNPPDGDILQSFIHVIDACGRSLAATNPCPGSE